MGEGFSGDEERESVERREKIRERYFFVLCLGFINRNIYPSKFLRNEFSFLRISSHASDIKQLRYKNDLKNP